MSGLCQLHWLLVHLGVQVQEPSSKGFKTYKSLGNLGPTCLKD